MQQGVAHGVAAVDVGTGCQQQFKLRAATALYRTENRRASGLAAGQVHRCAVSDQHLQVTRVIDTGRQVSHAFAIHPRDRWIQAGLEQGGQGIGAAVPDRPFQQGDIVLAMG